MNYRHHYHAGNYADVFKHALLLPLLRGLQRKEKGFLYLDTHAGRGGYDLSTTTELPGGRERPPEWPQGVGRLWSEENLPVLLAEYIETVRAFNVRHGAHGDALCYYPGSPWIAQAALRVQDRSALCELRADDAEALAQDFRRVGNASVHAMDGYTALRAMLPPPEKRALVLIDPPFENATEFADILSGLREGLRRFPSGVYAVWYPITERARSERFLRELAGLAPTTPTLAAEMEVTGKVAQIRMKGCGMVVFNPPWRIETEFRTLLPELVARLKLDDGAAGQVRWLAPER
jgi:23S rRNA (adenine2030-N6)-methyltransferase